jgi:hypothetical protein
MANEEIRHASSALIRFRCAGVARSSRTRPCCAEWTVQISAIDTATLHHFRLFTRDVRTGSRSFKLRLGVGTLSATRTFWTEEGEHFADTTYSEFILTGIHPKGLNFASRSVDEVTEYVCDRVVAPAVRAGGGFHRERSGSSFSKPSICCLSRGKSSLTVPQTTLTSTSK